MSNILNILFFFQRLHNGLCSTYESASTRRFQSGRVDCIRASHPEALDWAKSMHESEDTKDMAEKDLNANRKNLFMKAIAKQTKVMVFVTYRNFCHTLHSACHYLFDVIFFIKIQVMTDNITGKGLDVPILGIRKAVDEIWPSVELQGKEASKKHLKALFEDPVFDTANKFKLSTSQV